MLELPLVELRAVVLNFDTRLGLLLLKRSLLTLHILLLFCGVLLVGLRRALGRQMQTLRSLTWQSKTTGTLHLIQALLCQLVRAYRTALRCGLRRVAVRQTAILLLSTGLTFDTSAADDVALRIVGVRRRETSRRCRRK